MQSREYLDKPTHEHDCEKCEFQFGIRITVSDSIFPSVIDGVTPSETHVVDVYRQCRKSKPHIGKADKYLLRFSSDGPDYHSGIDFKSLCAGYFSFMHGLR